MCGTMWPLSRQAPLPLAGCDCFGGGGALQRCWSLAVLLVNLHGGLANSFYMCVCICISTPPGLMPRLLSGWVQVGSVTHEDFVFMSFSNAAMGQTPYIITLHRCGQGAALRLWPAWLPPGHQRTVVCLGREEGARGTPQLPLCCPPACPQAQPQRGAVFAGQQFDGRPPHRHDGSACGHHGLAATGPAAGK